MAENQTDTPHGRQAELDYAISWWLDRSRMVANSMDYVQALLRELRQLSGSNHAN